MSDYWQGATTDDHPTFVRQRHAARQAAEAQARADQEALTTKARADRDTAMADALRASDVAAGIWSARAPEYHEARGWSLGFDRLLSPLERRMFVYHAVDLALEAPALSVVWVTADSTADRLIGTNNAVYLGRERTIVVRGISTLEDAADVGHEIGHGRQPYGGSRLARERLAWEFSRARGLAWEASCHRRMATCVRTYVDTTRDKSDVLEVVRIERDLLSPASFRQHQRLVTPALREQFEAQEFIEAHGARACECGNAPAVTFDAGRAAMSASA